MKQQSYIGNPSIALRSQAGTRGKGNDDYADTFTTQWGNPPVPAHIIVVADGVTATAGGAKASKHAFETIKATLLEESKTNQYKTVSEWLEYAVIRANEEILFEAHKTPKFANMSTTLVMAGLVGGKLYIMHLGDSRAYLVRQEEIYQLTLDHTPVQDLIRSGEITPQAARFHPNRSYITRFLGDPTGILVDRSVIDPETGLPEEYINILPGDIILLCTDGVHGRLEDEEIKQVISESKNNLQMAIDALIQKAIDKNEIDDITAILMLLPPTINDIAYTTTSLGYVRQPEAMKSRPINRWVRIVGVLISALFVLTLWAAIKGSSGEADIVETPTPVINQPVETFSRLVVEPYEVPTAPLVANIAMTVGVPNSNAELPITSTTALLPIIPPAPPTLAIQIGTLTPTPTTAPTYTPTPTTTPAADSAASLIALGATNKNTDTSVHGNNSHNCTTTVDDTAEAIDLAPDTTKGVCRQFWQPLTGAEISSLTNYSNYPEEPTKVDILPRLETSDQGKDYGERLSGYLTPLTTGAYYFWIAADDSGQLWLSSDESPNNVDLIAFTDTWTNKYEWDKFPTQASKPIELQAGKRYYMMVLHKQADQKDNLAVAWQLDITDHDLSQRHTLIDTAYLAP